MKNHEIQNVQAYIECEPSLSLIIHVHSAARTKAKSNKEINKHFNLNQS